MGQGGGDRGVHLNSSVASERKLRRKASIALFVIVVESGRGENGRRQREFGFGLVEAEMNLDSHVQMSSQ